MSEPLRLSPAQEEMVSLALEQLDGFAVALRKIRDEGYRTSGDLDDLAVRRQSAIASLDEAFVEVLRLYMRAQRGESNRESSATTQTETQRDATA